jgi:thioredoxin-like negative regulator of GroEL
MKVPGGSAFRFSLLVSGVLFALALLPSPSLRAQQTGGVTVRVVDDREVPMSFAEVRLYVFGRGNYSFRGISSGGIVDFRDVSAGAYILEVAKLDYMTYRERLDIASGASTMVTVTLQPVKAEPAPASSSPTVSVESLAVPAAARKEFEAGLKAIGRSAEQCLGHLRKAVKRYPEYAEAYAWMGVAYLQKKQPADALKAAQKAIALDPRLAMAHVVVGKVHFQARKFNLAEPELKTAVELDPGSWQAPFELSRCYFNMGQMEKALEYARQAHADPEAPATTHLLLVDIYLRTGDRAGAIHELDEFAKAEPSSPVLPRVRAMRKRLSRQQ